MALKPMSRSFSLGELECAPTWVLGADGESCATACATWGLPCTDGDWGFQDQSSMDVAFVVVGQSASDIASLCSGGYTWDNSPIIPCVCTQDICATPLGPSRCYYPTGARSWCSAIDSGVRRLCRCA